jgi:hypothetical protein
MKNDVVEQLRGIYDFQETNKIEGGFSSYNRHNGCSDLCLTLRKSEITSVAGFLVLMEVVTVFCAPGSGYLSESETWK